MNILLKLKFLLLKTFLKGATLLLICSFQLGHTETEIYGSINYDFQNFSKKALSTPKFDSHYQHHNNETQRPRSKSQSRIHNNDTHIGIKGEKEIGNGNAIIYQLEWGNEK